MKKMSQLEFENFFAILGIELGSFLDKKSNVNDCIQFRGFFEKNKFGNVWERQGASFMDKKNQNIFCKMVWIFFPEMTLAQFSKIGLLVQNSRIGVNSCTLFLAFFITRGVVGT